MSNTTNQAATNQVSTSAQDLRARLERSLTIDGKAADAATISRVLNAKPKTSPRSSTLQTRPFSLLR